MRYLMVLVLVVAMVANAQWTGRPPIGKNENDCLYSEPAIDFDIYLGDVGMFSYSESVNGADSVAIWFDVSSTLYTHYEMWFWVSATGDATDEDMAGEINIYPAGDYASATAGDTLNWVNLRSDTAVFGKIYTTITTGSADAYQVGGIVPGAIWASPEHWVMGTATTDSAGFIIEAILKDSGEVTITALAIKRDV